MKTVIKFFFNVLWIALLLILVMRYYEPRKPSTEEAVQRANDIAARVAEKMKAALPEVETPKSPVDLGEVLTPPVEECASEKAVRLVANSLWQLRGGGLSTPLERRKDWNKAVELVHNYCEEEKEEEPNDQSREDVNPPGIY